LRGLKKKAFPLVTHRSSADCLESKEKESYDETVIYPCTLAVGPAALNALLHGAE